MRWLIVLLSSFAAFAQSDRGTITGTISDPAGAVVANAPSEARNIETGSLYRAASTATGNYTLAQLPTGAYEIAVLVPGFKRFIRQNVALGVAQMAVEYFGRNHGIEFSAWLFPQDREAGMKAATRSISFLGCMCSARAGTSSYPATSAF